MFTRGAARFCKSRLNNDCGSGSSSDRCCLQDACIIPVGCGTADAIRRISASCSLQHLRWLLFGRWIYAWTRDGLMWSLADQGGSLAAAGHGAWLQTTRCWRLWPRSSKALSARLTVPLKPGGIFASPRVAFSCRQCARSSPCRASAAQPPATNLCSSQHQPKQRVQWASIEVFRGKYHRFIPRAVTQ